MKLNQENIKKLTDSVYQSLCRKKICDSEKQEFIGRLEQVISEAESKLGEDADFSYRIREKYNEVRVLLRFPGQDTIKCETVADDAWF